MIEMFLPYLPHYSQVDEDIRKRPFCLNCFFVFFKAWGDITDQQFPTESQSMGEHGKTNKINQTLAQ